MDQDKVTVAFAVINKEITAIIQELNDEGAQAFRSSRYEDVDRLRTMGEELGAFRERVEQLKTQWVGKFGASNDNSSEPEPLNEEPPPAVPKKKAVREGTGLLDRLNQT